MYTLSLADFITSFSSFQFYIIMIEVFGHIINAIDNPVDVPQGVHRNSLYLQYFIQLKYYSMFTHFLPSWLLIQLAKVVVVEIYQDYLEA